MTRVFLDRLDSSDQGTFGKIHANGLVLFTGELPWRENKPNVSCIPEGIYPCAWTLSPRFRRFMYQVGAVPARAGIRKHSANFMGDAGAGFRCQLNGCISLGERLGWMDGQKALLLSTPALRRFEMHLNRQPFELEIRNA